MQSRVFMAAALSLSLVACGGSSNSPRAVDVPTADNNDGSPVTAVITARFDPTNAVIPFPSNLLLSGTTDLTLNIPAADPTDFSDPKVAMSALDGFSTTTPWTTTFSAPPAGASLVAGQNVRVFEVTLTGPGGGVTGVQRELASPQDFVVAPVASDTSGRTIAIVPTRPLDQITSYMAVLTNGITDRGGNDATADQTYFLAQRTSPLCVDGASTEPLLPAATACALEPVRQLVNSQEAAAAAAGVRKDSIVLSWVATTQSITPVMQAVQARQAQSPTPATQTAPTGMTLADLGAGLPPVADIHIGFISLPYYLDAPNADNPTAALTGFWHAAPGGYLPPFDAFGLDPTSTNVTFANPLPQPTVTQRAPLLLTVPNANSGKTKPANGWPVVIFQHGITRNRSDMFAIAGTMAAQGFAVVAIDQPLHGITDTANPLYAGNTPFAAAGVGERTFDMDLTDNASGAPRPDGVIDSSGAHFINLTSLLTTRDNLRQASVDLMELSRALPGLAVAGDSNALNANRVHFVGHSLGGIVGTAFLALDARVNVGVLNAPGGGLARMLDGSPTFGPRIRAGLAQAGVEAGTPDFDSFLGAAQTVIDSGDPINFAFATAGKRILLQEIVGDGADVPPDMVVPNRVAGAPLSGTEPLIAAMGLQSITGTTQSASGIRGVVRFLRGDHGSLLDPASFPDATAEMQGEMASMLVSDGHAVQVANPSVILTQ